MSAVLMKFKAGKPVEIKVEGIPGAACHDISRPYEELLGGRVISSKDTVEAALPPAQVTVGGDVNVGG